MTLRAQLIEKLSDVMDPENAADFIDRVIAEASDARLDQLEIESADMRRLVNEQIKIVQRLRAGILQ